MPGSVAAVHQSYLVECYWPGVTRVRVATSTRRAQEAAAVLAAQGTAVSYRSAFVILEDEVAFFLFDAASSTVVEDVCRRAELPFDRILSVTEIPRADGL